MSIFDQPENLVPLCTTCKSKNFGRSVLGPARCTFCDGTEGGCQPSLEDILVSPHRPDEVLLREYLETCPEHLRGRPSWFIEDATIDRRVSDVLSKWDLCHLLSGENNDN